jgi:hypothetical protein
MPQFVDCRATVEVRPLLEVLNEADVRRRPPHLFRLGIDLDRRFSGTPPRSAFSSLRVFALDAALSIDEAWGACAIGVQAAPDGAAAPRFVPSPGYPDVPSRVRSGSAAAQVVARLKAPSRPMKK